MNTLAELKRHLQIGVKVLKIEAWDKPVPEADQLREVVAVQTNAVVFKTPTKPKSWLEWPAASLVIVDNEGFTMYDAGYRDLTPDEKAVYDARPIDKEQSMQDAYTDGSVMFWREKAYFAKCKYPYLWGMNYVKGCKYDFNTQKIHDNKVLGQCICKYKFI
jgi:hypothetical protein